MEYHITDENFDEQVADGLVLVDFWATWCGPCRIQGPILEQLAQEMPESELKICKVDVDANPETPASFGVQGIPTMLLLKDGIEVSRLVGVHTKEQIKSVIAGKKLLGLI